MGKKENAMPIERTELLRALESVVSAAPGNPSLPILSTVALIAHDGRLIARCTDLDISIATTAKMMMQATGDLTLVNDEWSICLPAAKLLELVKVFDDGEIRVEAEVDRVTLHTANGKYKLAGMDAEDFPADSKMDSNQQIEFSPEEAEVFGEALNKVVFAASTDTATRTILTGVHMKASGGSLMLRATTGYMAAMCRIPAAGEMDIVVPAKAGIQKIIRMCKSGEPVVVRWKDAFLECESGPTRLDCRLLEGIYPDVERIIPEHTTKVTCNVAELRGVVLRNLSMADENSALRCEIAGSEVTMSAQSGAKATQATETVAVKTEGKETVVSLSCKYLLDVLKRIDSEEVVWMIKGPMDAMLLKPADNEDQRFVIMPMRGPKSDHEEADG